MSRNRLSYREFADLVIKVLQEHAELVYEPERFAVVHKDNGEALQRILLGGFYGEYSGLDPSERPALLAIIEKLFQQEAFPASWENASARLMPHIVDRASVFRSNMHLALGADPSVESAPDFAPFSVIAEVFALVLALDLPDSRVIVTDRQLAGWDVSFEQALDRAYENLIARSAGNFEILADQETGRSNVYASTWYDGYDASRMIVDALLGQFKVHGDCVIAVPTNNQLLVTGSEDRPGLLALHSYLVDAYGRPGCLPPVLVRKDATGWQRFQPASDAELGALLQDMYSNYLANAYAGQKALLTASMNIEGLPIVDYECRGGEGGCKSWSVLPPVPHALLPETDFVELLGRPEAAGPEAEPQSAPGQSAEDAESGKIDENTPADKHTVAFAHFKDVLGADLVDVEQYPPRYLLRAYPDDEKLKALFGS